MITRTAVVASKTGLHARPAALFAKAAAESPVPVTISIDGKPGVAAGSLLQVMTLGVQQGDTVTLSAEDGAEAVLDKLVSLLETDLDA
ncbi:HPr family phosphocarrier protein [Nocardia huaxiensis]|uniref:HPr family phosphocarrier protein n=1 Tax=Nocardia huaxiensis TaxID=2755382 RepID=UPI001E4078D7|nr:HPr family phosphocarrier protein [Nocardia huaxiensis]UFS97566.1 HPr family phosphocarrier protein [Nocardia huaxiensis]